MVKKVRARAYPAKRSVRRREPASRGKKSHSRVNASAKKKVVARHGGLTVTELAQLDGLRRELERTSTSSSPLRWNANPDDVQRSVAQLVLTLVEFIRKLLERQAIRRMEAGTLTAQQTEDIGRALMKLEQTVVQIASQFGILPEDLNLELGPIGKLM
jgi:hypothetical protein